ncbi:hypothetical protein ACFXG4_19080 [Nocardia sp. NPDC059246]|uniref:hypothetical protein n=1 Tax=unclassified Nocardia TaxID=2637762 RepID=UPI0036753A77
MAYPTLVPDAWRSFLMWWRFWGTVGFCVTGFLSFIIIRNLDGIPEFCGWRHPCPPQIILGLGAFPLYTWAAGGAVSWQLGRIALRHGWRPTWGLAIGALIFIAGFLFSLYMVANYWWPST